MRKKEPQIFTRTNRQGTPVDDTTLDAIEQEEMTESLVRKYVRTLLTEDPMGFVHDLAASSKEHGDASWGKLSKGAGQDIKRAFNKNADHAWLSTLDTVHWTDAYGLSTGATGKDELSATMSLPGGKLEPATWDKEVGLWIKGRITLASNDQDALYTGKWDDYMGAVWDKPRSKKAKEQKHRQKSSGVNKLPTVSKDYSRYDKLEPGNEYMEKMARNIPYVLDQSTWNPSGSEPNEALVDNWSPVGIIVVDDRSGSRIEAVKYHAQDPSKAVGMVKEIFQAATEIGVPLYDVDRNELWAPGENEIKEGIVREFIRSLLTEQEVKYQGILKLSPSPAIVSSVSALLQQLPPEAVPLPEDKFHVTLAHQSVLKPYKKQLKQLSKDGMLPPPPAVTLEGTAEERADEALDRKSWVVWVSNQDELKTYVQDVIQLVGGPPGDPEPSRRFHVSIANLTGNPGDSVR